MNATQPKDRREYFRLWHLRNRERRLAAHKLRYRAKWAEIQRQNKTYHEAHPEVAERARKKYWAANQEKCREANRKWREENLEEQRSRERLVRKKAFAKDPEKIRAANRAWAARNKDKIRLRDLRRKALKKGARVNLAHMQEWMDSVKSKRTATCYWCDKTILSKDLHFDHIVPLSKGGEHSVENLCVSCEACNCAKQAKLVTAWVRVGQQTLTL
jgi:5-methylcytosine-specific restriction endonuclease McrA